MPHILIFFSIVFSLCSQLRGEDWPEFRGPTGQGYSTAKNIPTYWSETENITWRTELPGKGWSSPVVEGDKIYMTTSIEFAQDEAGKEKTFNNGVPSFAPKSVDMYVLVVDRKSGKLLRNKKMLSVDNPQTIHKDNSYATPTPAVENGKLYCHFGGLGNACYDFAADKIAWTNTDLQIEHQNGPGSSPILWHDLMIFHLDGCDKQSIVALDKATGKVRWETPRSGEISDEPDLKKSCGTPLIINMPVNGKQQEVICSPGTSWVYFYEPATGKEIYRTSYEGSGFSLVPRPVMGHNTLYMMTGFYPARLLAIKIAADADQPAQEFKPTIKWRYKKSVPYTSSPLLVGDEIYFVHETGVLTCLDAHSGKVLYTTRLKGKFTSSPTLVENKIMLSTEEGKTIFFAPGKKYEELAKCELDGVIKASPPVIDHELYIRTDKALYRIEEKRK